ncbi:MAG: ATP-dependent DNA helicase [Oxalobacter formigenes]|nr:ATP-dependent DNA helicase [Oxalobacter formigenes]
MVDGYRMRPLQVEMSQAIADAIEQRETLVAEAGTGTGKTFAYLVPALLWGGKVIISTGTRHLQDQLFLKDMPVVRQALHAPVTVTLLKGRANYVCRLRLERTMEQGRLPSRADAGYLRSIARFARVTQTGDKAELAEVPENAMIWHMVTSTRDNCLGAECSHYGDCFVVKARQQAQQADVVVVNHHLFFADIALKDSGVAELLPTANTVIFDEAHQLPETATLFFGETVSTSHVFDLCRDTLAEGLAHAREAMDWGRLVSGVEKAARDLRLVFREDYLKLAAGQMEADHPLFARVMEMAKGLGRLEEALATQAERTEMLALCHSRAVDLTSQFAEWGKEAKGEADMAHVLWAEASGNMLLLHKTPLSVASIFTKQREEGPPRAWIFTSATLAIRGNFHYFASRLGLESARSQSWASPFDYARQGLLYVPEGLPLPNDPLFPDAVAEAVLPLIEASGGRTFVLCTTLRAVDRIAARFKEAFASHGWPFPLFVQGDSSRTELLARFREAGNGVLVGSQSFWEGVDVRGEALSLVAVDKLPFAPPDDPVLAARIAVLEKEGGNGFMDCQLPEAIMNLRQGSGRLIRDERDRGVLMICDGRLVSRRYGRRVWQSLPPFSRTRSLEQALAFLASKEEEA